MPQKKMTDTVVDNTKKVGDDLVNAGRSMWLAGLGAVAMAEEEARSTFDKLVDRGQKFEGSEKNVIGKGVKQATEKAEEFGKNVETKVQDTVQTVLNRAGVPSANEIQTLINRVEVLTEKVEALQK